MSEAFFFVSSGEIDVGVNATWIGSTYMIHESYMSFQFLGKKGKLQNPIYNF